MSNNEIPQAEVYVSQWETWFEELKTQWHKDAAKHEFKDIVVDDLAKFIEVLLVRTVVSEQAWDIFIRDNVTGHWATVPKVHIPDRETLEQILLKFAVGVIAIETNPKGDHSKYIIS